MHVGIRHNEANIPPATLHYHPPSSIALRGAQQFVWPMRRIRNHALICHLLARQEQKKNDGSDWDDGRQQHAASVLTDLCSRFCSFNLTALLFDALNANRKWLHSLPRGVQIKFMPQPLALLAKLLTVYLRATANSDQVVTRL